MSRTARRWCFTVGKEFVDGELFTELPPRAAFIIWQLEKAPTTDYLHYQGYVRMNNACTLGQIKRLLCNEAHIEKANGSEEKNIEYCSKAESKIDGPWELGERAKQGNRTDLASLVKMVQEGETNNAIAKQEPEAYARYAQHINRLRQALIVPTRRESLKVYILIGLTGTGKSYWAHQHFPSLYQPIIAKDRVWWDGYNQEDTVLFDDYRGAINYNDLLRYLDIYPLVGEVKGGTVALNYKNVIITSNDHFNEWYPQLSHSDLDPLRRRCTGGIFEIRSREDLPVIENQ